MTAGLGICGYCGAGPLRPGTVMIRFSRAEYKQLREELLASGFDLLHRRRESAMQRFIKVRLGVRKLRSVP